MQRMDYINAFWVGGLICALVQILMEKTKMMPGRIMVLLVVTGAVLSALGWYEPFQDYAGAGASVPLLGFGNVLMKGVKEAVQDNYCDLVIGSAWEKYIAEKEGIQVSFDVFEPTNRITYINESYFGFEGMLHLLQAFANDWERAFRSKNIEVNAY